MFCWQAFNNSFYQLSVSDNVVAKKQAIPQTTRLAIPQTAKQAIPQTTKLPAMPQTLCPPKPPKLRGRLKIFKQEISWHEVEKTQYQVNDAFASFFWSEQFRINP